MTRYIRQVFAVLALIMAVSCSEKGLDPKSQITDSQDVRNSFDEWIEENYTIPYNIRLLYRMEYNESDMNYYLVPAEYSQSVRMSKLIIHLCLEPYDEVTGSRDFIVSYFPKMIHLIGSAAYRNDGTFVLGTAEGGLKITLYMINSLPANLDAEYLNEYYFHTMHHEFAHILHQTRPYSPDFEMISGSDYVNDTWSDKWDNDDEARQAGFITAYASSEANEDFVELLATYVTNTQEYWDGLLSSAGTEGAAIISSKFDIVYNYMLESWSIDLDELREVIHRRQESLSTLDLENL